jgi:hypothetical protein
VDYLTDEQRSYGDKEPVELGADLQFGPLAVLLVEEVEKLRVEILKRHGRFAHLSLFERVVLKLRLKPKDCHTQ